MARVRVIDELAVIQDQLRRIEERQEHIEERQEHIEALLIDQLRANVNQHDADLAQALESALTEPDQMKAIIRELIKHTNMTTARLNARADKMDRQSEIIGAEVHRRSQLEGQ